METKDIDRGIQIANRILESLPKRSLNATTERLYRKTGERFWKAPEDILITTSKRTYYLRKAAMTFYATEQLKVAVERRDDALISHAAKVLLRFLRSEDPQDGAPPGKCPIASSKKRQSKRQSLSGLPENWRERLVQASSGELKEWILVLAVAGVRPKEIENGVDISPVDGGARLTVLGAKTNNGYGQPLRVIEVMSDLALQLAKAGARRISAPSANRVSVAIGRLGRRVFKRRAAGNVSAYSFRHQLASDLKASGLSSVDASAFLGHAVEDTKRQYGSHSQSRGSGRFKLVYASRIVKRCVMRYNSPSRGLGVKSEKSV
ncbi:site-specific integrase [Ramlibacter sp. 2FC]|uniref:site-specific integrase n=1 Tax=Ramlibacter sp. 2FC TaxID=2502188 RepID=UPI0010FA39D9|nr:site-specific integrase [Ramlibacter sp. 2FC]